MRLESPGPRPGVGGSEKKKTKKWEDLKENEEKVTDDGQTFVEINDDEEMEGSSERTKPPSRKDSCGTLATPTPKKLFSPESKSKKISKDSGENEQNTSKKKPKKKRTKKQDKTTTPEEDKTEEGQKQTKKLDPDFSPPNLPGSSGRPPAVRKLALLNTEISELMEKLKSGPHKCVVDKVFFIIFIDWNLNLFLSCCHPVCNPYALKLRSKESAGSIATPLPGSLPFIDMFLLYLLIDVLFWDMYRLYILGCMPKYFRDIMIIKKYSFSSLLKARDVETTSYICIASTPLSYLYDGCQS